MGEDPPSRARRELLRALGEISRAIGDAVRAAEEAERGILKALEDALGVPLSLETYRVRRLYRFPAPRQPTLDELRSLIARHMELEGIDDVLSYLKSISSGDPRPLRGGGRGYPRGDNEAGGEGDR